MPRPLNIALVEDNPDDVLLMQELLKGTQLQYFLTVLKDGEQALDFVKTLVLGHASVPDLIFLDLNLPKVSGHDILSEIRRHKILDQLRVVVLTTSENPEDKRVALANRADCYCVKPPALENLWNVLDIVENACLNIALSRPDSSVSNLAELIAEQSDDSLPEKQAILLIEDSPEDSLYLQSVLRRSNAIDCTIKTVETLRDAVAMLSSGDYKFDVILTDLGLPDAQGLQILSSLARTSAEIPVIIMTGLDDEKIALKAVSQGAQDYLVKGQINEATLLRSIKYAITRKQAEAMARMAVTFESSVLQEILQNAPISIARFDATLMVTACNDVFMRQFGSASQGVIGESVQKLLPSIESSLWQETITKGRPFKLDRCRVRAGAASASEIDDENEGPVWDLVVWSMKGKEGDIRGGIIIGIDVTQKVMLESQKEDFIAALAHDIKNPLIGTGQVLQSLVDGALGNMEDPQKDVLGMLKVSNDSVLLMLHNLLDVYRYESKFESSHFKLVDLAQTFDLAIATMAPLASDRNISIKKVTSEDLRPVKGDSTAINRLLTNLLHNALKFSREGDSVEISAENLGDNLVAIRVIDHGLGMNQEQEKELFKRFGQNKSRLRGSVGTGLGLYLCKQIAEAHQGSITCQNKLNEGCVFEVKLPACATVDSARG